MLAVVLGSIIAAMMVIGGAVAMALGAFIAIGYSFAPESGERHNPKRDAEYRNSGWILALMGTVSLLLGLLVWIG